MFAKIAGSVVIGLAAVGCGGGGPCGQFGRLESAYAGKVGACLLERTRTEYPDAVCKSAETACNATDKDSVNKTVECINKIPTCQRGQERAFEEAHRACQETNLKISDECRKAFNPEV